MSPGERGVQRTQAARHRGRAAGPGADRGAAVEVKGWEVQALVAYLESLR
jgi:hypothetical protein